jgi:type IV secretory pathway VirB6-like protein
MANCPLYILNGCGTIASHALYEKGRGMNQGIFEPQIALYVWVSCAALAGALIYRKGYHIATAIGIGVLLGPLSILIALFIPTRRMPSGD